MTRFSLWLGGWLVAWDPRMDLLGDVRLTQYVEDLVEVDLPLHSPYGDAGLGQELAPLLLDSLGENL